VTLEGRPIADLPRRQIARRIAMVPQHTQPAFDYTVLELALMGRYPHLGAFEVESARDLDIAIASLAATGTDGFAGRPFSTLSGGEQQRVVIASALAQQADLLLLDEPTASLDPGYQLEIATLLRTLHRDSGLTLVIATHDLNLAAAVCDTIALMSEGTVIAVGPTAEVLTRNHIASLYGIDADVHFHDEAGHLVVVPVRRTR
jgi:iron complex transport system ATP-binding protein